MTPPTQAVRQPQQPVASVQKSLPVESSPDAAGDASALHAAFGNAATGQAAPVIVARKRLEVLYKYEADWMERETRRIRSKADRSIYEAQRRAMDIEGDPRGVEEPGRIEQINRRALSIEVTADKVIFRVKFHVRFEGTSELGPLENLRWNLAEGARRIWNQHLTVAAFQGRTFELIPEVTEAPAKRDHNFWLITVRSTDKSDVNYPGCPSFQVPKRLPTSAAEPMCDGGVMSIPPSHLRNPDVLGHEMLHLFGLFDRYVEQIVKDSPTGPERRVETPVRETGGRPDPLGGQRGKVLAEDISLLFDRLGVYEQEENRGLQALRELERRGLTIETIRAEIRRLEEVVRNGGRPSLIRPRENFTDIMIRGAEEIP